MARANKTKIAEVETTQSTALSVFEQTNPVMVIQDSEKFDRFYDDMKRETDAMEIDLTTDTGRKRIASMAYKVARTKTAIDDAGKLLTEEWRANIKAVDDSRRSIRERLDALKDEVRKPLTDWEQAEEMRVDYCNRILRHIQECGQGRIDGETYPYPILLQELEEKVVMEDRFGDDYGPMIMAARESTLQLLRVAHDAHLKVEADRIELDRLRAAEAARLAEEAERKAQEELKAMREAAQRDAEETAKRQAEQRESDLKAAAEAAEKNAREKAEHEAKALADEKEAAHQAELAAAKRRADEAEAAQKAEADRIAKAKAAQEAEAKRVAEDQAARERNRAHRSKIMAAAKAAIMASGDVSEDAAKKVVLAIVAGEIPAVALSF